MCARDSRCDQDFVKPVSNDEIPFEVAGRIGGATICLGLENPNDRLDHAPSPASSARERRHTRSIAFEGFKRADGLWDIEGHLVDVKDHDIQLRSLLRRRRGDSRHSRARDHRSRYERQ